MSNVPVRATTKEPGLRGQGSITSLPDAGLKGLDHYSRKLPVWRHRFRQRLLPIVRWETPYLAKLQETCRTPLLDTYFAITANLGTHTFFMTALPICFWCGYTSVGRALVHMLALGVFWSGFIKDMVCLPRPLSPPLHRITMSGSAALEYGFPSTHSTNAVSVAFFFIYELHHDQQQAQDPQRLLLLALGYCYAISIILGRMYCGMHGFFDVVIGGLLGALIAVVQLAYGEVFDNWVAADPWTHPLLVIVLVLLAVRFHPEPADNCPCFDDSVAFAGVMIGAEIAHWHFSKTQYAAPGFPPATVAFDLKTLGWIKTALRIVSGVVIIFLWRAVMKKVLLRYLPPLFRVVESVGLTLPRRFFTRASQYKRVPPLRQDDNVIPSASEIPRMLSSFRQRKRGDSVGPQSEADAREFIAFREKTRRDSRSSQGLPTPQLRSGAASGFFDLPSPIADDVTENDQIVEKQTNQPVTRVKTAHLAPKATPDLPLTLPASDSGAISDAGKEEEEQQDRQMFLALEKPRIRYDVEVVTKLIIYTGIAWLAIEGNPILFEITGLGMRGL